MHRLGSSRLPFVCTLAGLVVLAGPLVAQPRADAKRPMTWPDLERLAVASSLNGSAVSPDGRRFLYAAMTMDWASGARNGDIHVVSTDRGLSSRRQLTFTAGKTEAQPRWTPDGSAFVFVSNREGTGAAANQLYIMRADSGSEARKITEAPAGIAGYEFSPDGRWLVYRTGRPGAAQLFSLPVSGLAGAAPVAAPQQLTKHPTGVTAWQFAPDAKRIYFTSSDAGDPDERARVGKGFTVILRHQRAPLASLFALDIDGGRTTRLTKEGWSVVDFTVSRDSRWVAFRGLPQEQAPGASAEAQLRAEVFLIEAGSGRIERLSTNAEGLEMLPSFSPDSRSIAYTGGQDRERFNLRNTRVYIRAVDDANGAFRQLGTGFDGDVRVGVWSPDNRTIYFDAGVKATTQTHALDVSTGAVKQVTNVTGAVTLAPDPITRHPIITYSDPVTPPTKFFVPDLARLADRSSWVQLTDKSPLVTDIALGDAEEVSWKSRDGTMVGGIIMKPVGYEAGKRYPLIVVLHGGPHSAEVLQFNGDGSDGGQIYAGAGYLVFFPNYRGSTNYGEKFKLGIVGNYSDRQFEDVMTGVDHLIARGLADGNRMGVIGNSSGGTLGNWILTHTDRFKAISSGAGISNWVSMYAQSDVQRGREYWMGGTPYEKHETYWNHSPMKYIRNAKTPTLIWAIQNEARVPAAQSLELYMGLRAMGVPTELLVYPGDSHATPNSPRNRLHRITAEMMWMDYYLRDSGRKFSWRDMLRMIE